MHRGDRRQLSALSMERKLMQYARPASSSSGFSPSVLPGVLARRLTKSFPGIAATALATIVALSGCKQENSTGGSPSYFKTHFQDESQFIVETVLADLAEMTYFAKTASLPDSKVFSVQAREMPGSAFRAPVYDVEIVLQPNQAPVKAESSVSGPIWSPEVYSQIVGQLFERLGLNQHRGATPGTDDLAMMLALQDASAGTIEKEN